MSPWQVGGCLQGCCGRGIPGSGNFCWVVSQALALMPEIFLDLGTVPLKGPTGQAPETPAPCSSSTSWAGGHQSNTTASVQGQTAAAPQVAVTAHGQPTCSDPRLTPPTPHPPPSPPSCLSVFLLCTRPHLGMGHLRTQNVNRIGHRAGELPFGPGLRAKAAGTGEALPGCVQGQVGRPGREWGHRPCRLPGPELRTLTHGGTPHALTPFPFPTPLYSHSFWSQEGLYLEKT